MKRNYFIILIVILASFLMSGCVALHSGFMNDSASLSSNNFKYVKLASGQAKATLVFGIGGLKEDAMVAAAKSNLIQKNPLKEGQTIANVAVDRKQSIYFGIVVVTKVTVTADIVEFK